MLAKQDKSLIKIRFKTDMGSLAYEKIYDLLELDDALTHIGMKRTKDEPSEVRKIAPSRVNTTMDIREYIEDEIVGWLKAVKKQESGTNDITLLNELFNNKLSQRGILQQALPLTTETTQAA